MQIVWYCLSIDLNIWVSFRPLTKSLFFSVSSARIAEYEPAKDATVLPIFWTKHCTFSWLEPQKPSTCTWLHLPQESASFRDCTWFEFTSEFFPFSCYEVMFSFRKQFLMIYGTVSKTYHVYKREKGKEKPFRCWFFLSSYWAKDEKLRYDYDLAFFTVNCDFCFRYLSYLLDSEKNSLASSNWETCLWIR